MTLAPGTRLGSYEIQTLLGAGGMGQVYRARDTKLSRDVAIKTLPDLFADDPERVARFEREAQLLAALNHPHIGGIYGFESADGHRFLVLELVDGQSLADRIATHGRLEPHEAIGIARQIAGALEAAHEKGIIHRDLKPANVMLTADGEVKVLDFGLARSIEAHAGASAVNSPTLTFAGTEFGMILGTAAYMSPEQAKGRVADKRSDVWSFGCVLYEMLTGRRAFDGEDVSDTLAAVLRGEPDWTALPAGVPAYLQVLLKRCLQRDRKVRVPDISVVRYMLDEASVPQGSSAPVPLLKPSRVRLLAVSAIALLLGAGLTAGGLWAIRRGTLEPPRQRIQFSFVAPAAQRIAAEGVDRAIAISPDARHIVYVGGDNGARLHVRAMDSLDVTTIAGISNARMPFVSADSRWIGYVAGRELRKVPIGGGPSVSVCQIAGAPRGATWLPDNTIVFATSDTTTGLFRVSAAGGEPQAISKPDPAIGEQDHLYPSALPDGRGVLFTIVGTGATPGSESEAHVAVLDLSTGTTERLIQGGSQPEYVAGGSLVFAVAGALNAVRFDPGRRQLLSEPVPVVRGVSTKVATGATNYAASRDGHLVYVPDFDSGTVPARSLVWVDRQGREESLSAPPRGYAIARLSPDDQRIAVDIREQESDIWVLDLARGTPLSRLTFDAAADRQPVWTRDGRRIIFQSDRSGPFNLFAQAADNTGATIRLTTSAHPQAPDAVTSDGRLVFTEIRPQSSHDLLALLLDGKTLAETLVQTPSTDAMADLSPDGRWLAYQSNESGSLQIYVKPFPNANAGRWQISTSGGSNPVWSRSGGELFFQSRARAMMSVAVQTTPAFSHGTPVKLFDTPYFGNVLGRPFDVSRDGKRFLVIKSATNSERTETPGLVVITNWLEDVKTAVK